MDQRLGRYASFWVNTSIRHVAEAGLLGEFSHVLVTSIDSSTDLRHGLLRDKLAGVDQHCASLDFGVIISGLGLAKCAQEFALLNGFDEVWCFREKPHVAMPQGVSIVAPFRAGTDLIASDLLLWMEATSCVLGMGDGVGLNVLTVDRGVADCIRRLGV